MITLNLWQLNGRIWQIPDNLPYHILLNINAISPIYGRLQIFSKKLFYITFAESYRIRTILPYDTSTIYVKLRCIDSKSAIFATLYTFIINIIWKYA